MNVNELESKCVKSPDFQLNSLFWTIELCESSNSVNVSLVSHINEDAIKYSCDAEAVVKLYSPYNIHGKKDYMKIEKTIINQTFDAENFKHEINLVKWDELLENYVHNNETLVEFKISVDRPVRTKQTETTLLGYDIIIQNVSQLTSYFSPHFVVRGMRWKVHFKRQSTKTLSILLLVEEDDLVTNEFWEVHTTIELKSFRKYGKSYIKDVISWYFKGMTIPYWVNYEWNNVMDPSYFYIKDDIAIFNVQVNVKNSILGKEHDLNSYPRKC